MTSYLMIFTGVLAIAAATTTLPLPPLQEAFAFISCAGGFISLAAMGINLAILSFLLFKKDDKKYRTVVLADGTVILAESVKQIVSDSEESDAEEFKKELNLNNEPIFAVSEDSEDDLTTEYATESDEDENYEDEDSDEESSEEEVGDETDESSEDET